MSSSRLAYLFDRYVKEKHTPMEKAGLMKLVEQTENEEVVKQLIGKLLDEAEADMLLPEKASENILQAVLRHNTPVAEMQVAKRILPKWTTFAAASVVFLLLAGYMINRTIYSNHAVAESIQTSITQQVSTGISQRKNIILPDGTQVWLSPSTLLEYPSVFNGNTREIKLSGEGFFEVAHDASHPFIIHSDDIQTTVLGTSFNLQAYRNHEKIAVMVVTGKVKLSKSGAIEDKKKNMEISANQRAVFDKNTDWFMKEDAEKITAPNMLKRKEGVFVYKNEPLLKLTEDMEEYFGIKIKVADKIKNCKVVASFDVTDKPEDILEVIAIAINGKFLKKRQQYFIEGNGCL